jgi:HD-GYP domain-containing protein (c-di-GMP phosphodiesterase class II)
MVSLRQLEVSAVEQQFGQKPAQDFTFYKVEQLVDNSVTDFDLFISLDKHFILYSGSGYRWNRTELTELLQAGHQSFYIRAVDLPKAEMYRALTKLPEIEKSQAPAERIQSIEQIGAKFTQCLYEGNLTEACVDKAKGISRAIVDCIAEDKGCVKFLGQLSDHDYYTYYHSVRVAAYAVAVAIGMGLNDHNLLRSIALGGIFHDIGKKEVPLALLNKTGALTEAEWKTMRSHPTLGHAKIEDTILSHVPREIILHHHEKLNGAGYPHGLDKGSLLPEVQIATLADIFDALTSTRSYQNKRTRYEALDFIKHRLVKEEVSADAFKALVICLAS